MADNAWQAEPANADALWATAIRRSPYVLDVAEDTQTIDLQTSLVVYRDGTFFAYDPTDSTTAHDGVAVLVDQNGRRYKLTDDLKRPLSVLDRTGTPPGGPSVGDAYLLTAGATGAWAAHDDDIAFYTSAGWQFKAPEIGMQLFVEDEGAYYHYSAGGAWVGGLGSLSLSADAVTPTEVLFWGGQSVEAVLDAPPGSPANGAAWLVGTSPSGDFAGHNDKLAFRRGGAWEFHAPYEGAKTWDKATDVVLTYNGGWAAPAEITPVETEIVDLSGQTSVDVLDLAAYVKLEIYAHLSSSAIATFRVQVSTDNGSTFKTGASDYTDSGNTSFVNNSPSGCISLIGFNKAAPTFFTRSGTVTEAHRNAIEVNNAIRISAASAFASGAKAVILKYRG